MNDYCQTNFLQPTGFRVIISKDKNPHLSFISQSVTHPSMELESTEVGRPRISSVPFIGDAIQFGTVTFDVLLDEEMNVYSEIYNWMEQIVETKHKLNSTLSDYCDIRVKVLTSSNNSNREIQYVNAFPVSLGDVQFAATNQDTFITAPMTFRFDYFEFL